jgi:thiol:disulfide interchange protein
MYFYYTAIVILIILIVSPSLRSYITSCVYSDSSKSNTSSKEKKTVREKFDSNLSKIVLTSYTAEWCPHCVTYKSQAYEDLSKMFRGDKKIVIQNVDCTNDRDGSTRTLAGNAIDGYPTLMVNTYDENNNMMETAYSGARDAETIANYLRNL